MVDYRYKANGNGNPKPSKFSNLPKGFTNMSYATFNFELSAEEIASVAPHINYEYPGCCELNVEHIEINEWNETITLTLGNSHGDIEVDATPAEAEDFGNLTSRYEGDEITGYRLEKAIYSLNLEEGYVVINA